MYLYIFVWYSHHSTKLKTNKINSRDFRSLCNAQLNLLSSAGKTPVTVQVQPHPLPLGSCDRHTAGAPSTTHKHGGPTPSAPPAADPQRRAFYPLTCADTTSMA